MAFTPDQRRIRAADKAVHELFSDDPGNPRYAHWRRAVSDLDALKPESGRILYCLGDSHLAVVSHIRDSCPLPGLVLAVCQIRGATAAGLGNPGSLVHSRRFLDSYLLRIPPDAALLLCFGEVDCNSGIPFRMQRYGTGAGHEVAASLAGFSVFLALLIAQGRSRLIVLSAPPPCQRKDKPSKDRRLWLDLPERTRITRLFNSGLAGICTGRGIFFLNLEDHLIDPVTGIVRQRFLQRSKTNHHLDSDALAPVVRHALSDIFKKGRSIETDN